MTESPPTSPRIATVGHGTLPADEFAALLKTANVSTLVDVRRYPGSRKFPHYGAASMAAWLPAANINYIELPDLGGRRRPTNDLTNGAWRNPQFRAYADHMATDEFAQGVAALMEMASATSLMAVMCSESVWWRCHRRLLADHLQIVEGITVEHLFHDGRLTGHVPTPEARPAGRHLTYPVG